MFSDEIDGLLVELAASLVPPQRAAFEAAAREVLAATNCSGVGAAYRLIGPLQRDFRDPEPDLRVANTGARHFRPSKLIQAEPIGGPDPREDGRVRRQFRAVE